MSASTITSLNTPDQVQQQKSRVSSGQNKEQIQGVSLEQQQKASLNVSILESTKVTIGAKDQSLSLLLNTAIDKINELLAPELGENAIQKTADSGLDMSPEATAERIVNMSTAFFGAYKEQNSSDDESIVLSKFIETIRRGIEQGFKEARDILEGLNVLQGDIASNIDETYTLVQEKIETFGDMILDQLTAK